MESLVSRNFWAGRRVFVTGHTGFKGGWLCLALQGLGAETMGYSLPPDTDTHFFGAVRLAEGMGSVIADIRDAERLTAEMEAFAPEVVLHLAAQPLVRVSYEKPLETYMTNVMGTVHVLEAVRATPTVRAVVVVTSDKAYENREWTWGYREADPLGGHDPYSSSKGCAEIVTSAYARSFFCAERGRQVGIGSARAGNVIAGGDWSRDRLVPDVVAAFRDGRPATIRSPGSTRPWQHVLEPVFGYLMLAERLHGDGAGFAGAWNFGPADDDVRTVREVTTMLARTWNGASSWEERVDPNAPHEARQLKLDTSKARALLGWKPRWSLPQAVAATVEWYQAEARGDDMRALSSDQIQRYTTALPG